VDRPNLTAGPITDDPLLFARYAYPPNELGYCGGEDHRALLEQPSAGVVDGDLRQMLREFEGGWPYLELIAAANHLDARWTPGSSRSAGWVAGCSNGSDQLC